MKGPSKPTIDVVQPEVLDELNLVEEEIVIPKKVNFRRLLAEGTDKAIDTKYKADQQLHKAAKVLERMVVQDANMDITFG